MFFYANDFSIRTHSIWPSILIDWKTLQLIYIQNWVENGWFIPNWKDVLAWMLLRVSQNIYIHWMSILWIRTYPTITINGRASAFSFDEAQVPFQIIQQNNEICYEWRYETLWQSNEFQENKENVSMFSLLSRDSFDSASNRDTMLMDMCTIDRLHQSIVIAFPYSYFVSVLHAITHSLILKQDMIIERQ